MFFCIPAHVEGCHCDEIQIDVPGFIPWAGLECRDKISEWYGFTRIGVSVQPVFFREGRLGQPQDKHKTDSFLLSKAYTLNQVLPWLVLEPVTYSNPSDLNYVAIRVKYG